MHGYGAKRVAGNLALITFLSFGAGGAVADALRVIAFGDSLTQGYGLPPEAGLTARLEAWLRARGHDVTIINAGVSGDTTSGGLSRIDWTLADPADAIIVELGANDMLRGTDPQLVRANLEAIMQAVAAKGLPSMLVAVPSIANYGAAYENAFNAIFPDLAATYGAVLFADYFAPLVAAVSSGADMNTLMQPDGMHPSAAGVDILIEALGPEVETLLSRIGE